MNDEGWQGAWKCIRGGGGARLCVDAGACEDVAGGEDGVRTRGVDGVWAHVWTGCKQCVDAGADN